MSDRLSGVIKKTSRSECIICFKTCLYRNWSAYTESVTYNV